MKKKRKSQKHINFLKHSSRLKKVDIQSISKGNKNSVDKVPLERKSVSDNKDSDSPKSFTLISSKSLSNDIGYINVKKNESSSITKNRMSNACSVFMKEDEIQQDYNSHYSKTPKFVDQNIVEFKATENILKKDKLDNYIPPHVPYAIANTVNSCSLVQSKEELTSQENNDIETLSFNMCQSGTGEQSSKQELPTSTNCSAMQKCETLLVDMHNKHFIIKQLKSINDHSSQITEIINQIVSHQVNDCPNYTKGDCKPLVSTSNDVDTIKAQDVSYDMFNQKENDVKSTCENANKSDMLNDCNKCFYMNHIGEHVIVAHTGKGAQWLVKSNDMCTVSAMFAGASDYDNAAKYPENIMKEQEEKNNCDNLTSNHRIHSSELCTYDINSLEVGLNAEMDYESLLKTDYINDTENNSSLDNFQNETLESTTSQINYACENEGIKWTNIIDMLNDNKCVYVANHTDEPVMIMNVDERRVQCLDNSGDICTSSISFTEDQNIGLSDDPYIYLENIIGVAPLPPRLIGDNESGSKYSTHWRKRLRDAYYMKIGDNESDSKYPETMMKEFSKKRL